MQLGHARIWTQLKIMIIDGRCMRHVFLCETKNVTLLDEYNKTKKCTNALKKSQICPHKQDKIKFRGCDWQCNELNH